MALATAQGLADEFETIFIGPPGLGLIEAQRLGFQTRQYRTSLDLARVLKPLLRLYPSLTFVGTGPRYHLVCMALNLFFRRKIRHIHVLHGGSGIDKDYARKRVLNFFDIPFVVVSEWSKQRLIDHGVRNRIEVIGNFLTPKQLREIPKRPRYTVAGVRRALIVSRVDREKRVDLLLDALDRRRQELSDISLRILGVGPELDALRERAGRTHPNVQFAGFSDNVAGEMAQADLLVHPCPVETFGLVILEAMAANLAVLAADAAGTGAIIHDGVNGFKFRPEDAGHLAQRLLELHRAGAQTLNAVVAGGRRTVEETYSSEKMLAKYRTLFRP